MLVREKSETVSTPLRVLAVVVILASVTASIFISILTFSSNFYSRSAEALFIEGFLASVVVSGVGGLWMISATKNSWWLLVFLPVFGGFGLWLLVSLMTPVTLH